MRVRARLVITGSLREKEGRCKCTWMGAMVDVLVYIEDSIGAVKMCGGIHLKHG